MIIAFFHEFTPPTATAQTRRHTRSGASYLPANTKRAAALLQAVFEKHAPATPLTGPLEVRVIWTWPGETLAYKITPPDLDNLAKLALDAATKAGWWHNDAWIVHFTTAKFVGPLPGLAVSACPATISLTAELVAPVTSGNLRDSATDGQGGVKSRTLASAPYARFRARPEAAGAPVEAAVGSDIESPTIALGPPSSQSVNTPTGNTKGF